MKIVKEVIGIQKDCYSKEKDGKELVFSNYYLRFTKDGVEGFATENLFVLNDVIKEDIKVGDCVVVSYTKKNDKWYCNGLANVSSTKEN